MRDLDVGSMRDILVGLAFLSTGGGGTVDEGWRYLKDGVAAGRSFRLASPDELPPDTLLASAYYCGSMMPSGRGIFTTERAPYAERECVLAIRVLEGHLGHQVGAIVPPELGAGNAAAAFAAAAELGIPILDADAVGRCVPELQHSAYFLAGIPIAPIGISNQFGDTALIRSVVDDFHAEALVRSLAVASGGSVGVADHPGPMEEHKEALAKGSISFAERVGTAIRNRKAGLVDSLLGATTGVLLFEGVVASDCRYEERDGFTIGEIRIRGEGSDQGRRYRIWFKNENIIAWKDGKVDATTPDLICLIAVERRWPVINPRAKRGQRVAVIGVPAPAIWRTPKGIELLGPKHFGFRAKFVPVEARRSRARA